MFRKKKELCSNSKAIAIMYLEQKARELEDSITITEDYLEDDNKRTDIRSLRETIDFLIRK